MKVNSSIVASFVVGVAIASLPYTLSSGKTVAQAAGPGQTQGGFGGGQQGGPAQGFPPGQGFPGQGQGQGFPGQQGRPQNSPMVNSMTTSGDFLFASAGDVIYKIRISNMTIEGQAKLPAPRNQQQQGGGQINRGGAGRPPQGGGNGSGGLGGANGGATPPSK